MMSGIDKYTTLCLHCDGNDGSTVFVDSSYKRHIITTNGGARADATKKVFGSSSLLLDGDGDYLTVVDSNDWYLSNTPWTIDTWLMFASTSGYPMIVTQTGTDTTNWWQLYYQASSTSIVLYVVNDGNADDAQSNTWSPNTGVWYHIAVVYTGGMVYFYVNGASLGSSVLSQPVPNSTNTLNIGAQYDGGWGNFFNGNIDEFRISSGVARYSSSFVISRKAYSFSRYLGAGSSATGVTNVMTHSVSKTF